MRRTVRWAMTVLPALLALQAGAEEAQEGGADGWTLAKSKDGVEVYNRDVPGSVFKESRASAVVPAPLAEVLGWYTDPATYTQWIDSCVEARRVGPVEEGSDIATTYFKFNFPFPATDRDVVLRAQRLENSATVVVYEGHQAEGVLPEVDGLVRIPMLRNRWEFRAKGEAETEVTVLQHMDAGGSLPGFILNRAAVDNPIGTLSGLARYAEKNRSSGAGE